jgi:hypothetical protein
MYAEFVEWVEKQKSQLGQAQERILEEIRRDVQLEALVFFGKKQLFDLLVEERSNKIRLKKNLPKSSVHK